jgi:hypothetical protein
MSSFYIENLGGSSVTLNEPIGEFKFGTNSIKADRTGRFTLHLTSGRDWIFDLGELTYLDAILAEFETIKKGRHERSFWRTNGSKIVQVIISYKFSDTSIFFDPYVFLVEGGTHTGRFYVREINGLRKGIHLLTSEGAPYGRSIRLLDVIEEDRYEELVAQTKVPLNNRNSNSPLIMEREYIREAKKVIHTETSFGVGFDYYIALNLETRYGVNREDKISERVMLRMEAQPGEHKAYTIIWKEVWITGYGVFDMGNNRNEKIRFRLKSGLEADIRQERLD